MSGIAGIIRFDGGPVAPGQIERMTSAMAFRGPDGIGHWHGGAVALGHCMLRTTPQSLEETQPLANEDESVVLVMDGWLANPAELRGELMGRGARMRTRADAELVLRAYETWGEECLNHIDGDFALVVWDARRRTAFCARDRIGNNPFYYHHDGKRLVFASDVAAIFAGTGQQCEINVDMLAQHLACEWHTRDQTLWRGIERLVPGHAMSMTRKAVRRWRYWLPDFDRRLSCRSDQEFRAHYRTMFEDCVRRASRSLGPLACEVSGGHDSSAVLCMADRLKCDGRLPAPDVRGYTLTFDDPEAGRDLPFARSVARHTGVAVEEIEPSVPSIAHFAEYARRFRDFPGFPNAAMFAGMRARAVAAGSRVALTGEGGDEYLGGSRLYYAEELRGLRWANLAACFRGDAALFGRRQMARWLIGYGVLPHLPEAATRMARAVGGPKLPEQEPYWLAPGMREIILRLRAEAKARPKPRVAHAGQAPLLDELDNAFTDLVMEHSERFAAVSGIELRHPMRSRQFVEAAFATPERMRVRGNVEKFLHLEGLADILPPEILQRRDKAEFSAVFRTQLAGMREKLATTLPNRRGDWLNADGVRQALSQVDSSAGSGNLLWMLWAAFACDLVVTQQEGSPGAAPPFDQSGPAARNWSSASSPIRP